MVLNMGSALVLDLSPETKPYKKLKQGLREPGGKSCTIMEGMVQSERREISG